MQTLIPPFGLSGDVNPLNKNIFTVQNTVDGATPPPPEDSYRVTCGGTNRDTCGDEIRIIT